MRPPFHLALTVLDLAEAELFYGEVLGCQEGRRAETDCRDNVKSIAMVFAAIESARKGCKLPVSW